MNREKLFEHFSAYAAEKKVINTHSHHHMDGFYKKSIDLKNIFKNSYLAESWTGLTLEDTSESRNSFIEKMKYNAYYIWLEKGLQTLYGFSEPLSAQNWDTVSGYIHEKNQAEGFHLQVLKKVCGYETVILDNLADPGGDNGHKELFNSTLRINGFLYGYSEKAAEHNGFNYRNRYAMQADSLSAYVDAMEKVIIQSIENGCVALKSAIAYDRTLDIEPVTKACAEKAFLMADDKRTDEDIKCFQDYIFSQLCEIAAEHNLPLQCHTGLARLEKTNAMQMLDVIERHPDTQFVLFHGGYPWTDDILALVHNYHNVYPDLCWLPIISSTRAVQFLKELLEVGQSHQICWGCDTWTSEESLGALLAMRWVLAKALSSQVADGLVSTTDAERMIDIILYDNAKSIYRKIGHSPDNMLTEV